jgi:hypothetical protein
VTALTVDKFLLDRLVEYEAEARSAVVTGDSPEWTACGPVAVTTGYYRVRSGHDRPVVEAIVTLEDDDDPDDVRPYVDGAAVAKHIARHDPARAFREIRAQRALVRKYRSAVRRQRAEWKDFSDWAAGKRPRERKAPLGADRALIPGLELAIRIVAATYSRHPDYQKEWRP